MEVPTELETRLSTLAQRTRRSTETLLHEAIERYAEREERFIAAVDQGITSADRGDFIEDDAVLAWLEHRESP